MNLLFHYLPAEDDSETQLAFLQPSDLTNGASDFTVILLDKKSDMSKYAKLTFISQTDSITNIWYSYQVSDTENKVSVGYVTKYPQEWENDERVTCDI